jgi:hypothetical protein
MAVGLIHSFRRASKVKETLLLSDAPQPFDQQPQAPQVCRNSSLVCGRSYVNFHFGALGVERPELRGTKFAAESQGRAGKRLGQTGSTSSYATRNVRPDLQPGAQGSTSFSGARSLTLAAKETEGPLSTGRSPQFGSGRYKATVQLRSQRAPATIFHERLRSRSCSAISSARRASLRSWTRQTGAPGQVYLDEMFEGRDRPCRACAEETRGRPDGALQA